MITQTIDHHNYVSRARQIKARIPTLLTRWGLLPRFKRWRLARDPDTGLIVLFGVLNNKFISMHTTTSLTNYFDPSLLSDLSSELHVPVISSTNDGLRYAFILERGQIDKLPAHLDPLPGKEKLIVRVVYSEQPAPPAPEPPIAHAALGANDLDDQKLVDQGVEAYLKVFEDIKLRDEAAQPDPVQTPPDFILFKKTNFNSDE